MPRNGQAKRTPAHRKASMGREDCSAVARTECLDNFAEWLLMPGIFTLNSRIFRARKQLFSGRNTLRKKRNGWPRFVARSRLMCRLRTHRPNAEWIRSEVAKNWNLFEAERENLTSIVCAIFTHAGVIGSAGEAESGGPDSC